MGQPENAGFTYDYGLLHAAPNCDLSELKRCYRLAVRDLHPDRNPDLANDAAAQGALRELTASYRRLIDYHRSYGHLPGELPRRTTPQAKPVPSHTRVARHGWAPWTVLISIAFVIAHFYWPRTATRSGLPAGNAPAQSMQHASGAEFDPRFQVSGAATPKTIRIGDTKLRVRTILGSPILGSATAWEYGPSHVIFKKGRVVDWYSSPLKPLPVDEKSREPGWVNPDVE